MSALKVKQVKAKLLELFEKHLDLSDIGATDVQREDKIVSRCLAAYAVYSKSGCSAQEAADSVWDGGGDNGIDAGYLDQSGARVILAQSKWIKSGTGEPSAAEIGTFANGVRDTIEQELGNFAPRLHAKLEAIGKALDVPGTSVEIVLISTGSSTIAAPGTANLDRLLNELNGDDIDALVRKSTMGLAEVFSGLASDSLQDGITLDLSILEWSKISEPEEAYFGVIDGHQLSEWWHTFGSRLVAKNIRHALGATDVNAEIRQSAISDPDHFWYFNNGITLTATEALKAPKGMASKAAGTFRLKGASIVNGAQTVSTLGRIDNEESLARVRVPIRAILLDRAAANFGEQVTRTNNLQNRVEARDFVAQDPEQRRLQDEMRIEGVDYQYLRSELSLMSENACDLIEVTTALACATGEPMMAVNIKTGIGRFFADLKKAPYVTIFNPTTNGANAFNATLLQRSIDLWIEGKKRLLAKKSGFGWGLLIHGNRILSAAVFRQVGKETLNQPIADFRKAIEKLDIDKACEAAYGKMLAKLEKDYQGKFLASLFKNPSMSKDVFSAAE